MPFVQATTPGAYTGAPLSTASPAFLEIMTSRPPAQGTIHDDDDDDSKIQHVRQSGLAGRSILTVNDSNVPTFKIE